MTTSEDMSAFEKAAEAWRGANFSKVQKSLDEQATKVEDYQKQGTESRQDLATKTREFRKLEAEQRSVQIKPLLKRYQQEIDELTNRCKFAESCFIGFYGAIGDLVDPVPILEAAAVEHRKLAKLESLKAENEKLKATLAHQSDYEKIKTQVQAQAQKFQQDLAKQIELAATDQEAAIASYQKAAADKERELECQIVDLKQALQVAEARLSLSDDAPAPEGIQLPEHRAIVRELERASAKVQQLTMANSQLSAELTARNNSHSTGTEALAKQVEELEVENARLEQRMASQAARAQEERQQLQQAAAANAQTAQQLTSELELAQSELALKQDYDQIKQELVSLRQLEFGDLEPETDQTRLLESLNARLEQQLVALRIKQNETEQQLANVSADRAELEQRISQASEHIQHLESDLAALSRDDAMSTVSGWTTPVAGSVQGPNSTGGDSSVIAILSQQRDRYKDRAAELEKEARRATSLVATQRKELTAIKNDNKELYERLRYVEQHGQERASSSKGDRFKSAYEDGLASFQQFKDLETERALAGRGKLDRWLFSFLQRFVTDQRFRVLTLGYIAGIHLLLLYAIIS